MFCVIGDTVSTGGWWVLQVCDYACLPTKMFHYITTPFTKYYQSGHCTLGKSLYRFPGNATMHELFPAPMKYGVCSNV